MYNRHMNTTRRESKAITQAMRNKYLFGASIEELMELYGLSRRSVTRRLSHSKVYVSEGYRNSYGEKPVSKLELRERIEALLNVELEGLEGASKSSLSTLHSSLKLLPGLEC